MLSNVHKVINWQYQVRYEMHGIRQSDTMNNDMITQHYTWFEVWWWSFAGANPGLDLVTSVAAGSGRMLVLVLRHLIRIGWSSIVQYSTVQYSTVQCWCCITSLGLVGAAELSILLPGYITPATTCSHSENQNLSKGVLLVPTTDSGI